MAYVTRAAEVRFGDGDLLIVDASDPAVKSGVTAASVLRAAHERGATMFSCPGLHAKVLLFDNVAVVGSANISATSVSHKIEAALITNDRSIVKQARSLIVKLTRQSDSIDEGFLTRISKIKVTRRRPESSRRDSGLETTRREEALRFVREAKKRGVEIDKPRVLSFRGKTFSLTGFFDVGTQDQCARATRKLGGRQAPSNALTRNVDVLVVGTHGNPNYLWKTYGTKIQRANDLREIWGKPLIVSEYRWRKEIGR